MISRTSFDHRLARFLSMAAFLCLMPAHLL